MSIVAFVSVFRLVTTRWIRGSRFLAARRLGQALFADGRCGASMA